MLSFTDFLLEKSNTRSNRLLTENVEKDVYWLNVNFFNYLYLIQNKKFNEDLNQGNPQLSFISSGTSSTEKSKFENVFDYPVTLYFNKKELLAYLDLLESKGNEEEKSETKVSDVEEEDVEEETDETEVSDVEEEEPEEIPTELSIPINNFTFNITKNEDILTKVELNVRSINEMRLEKDFKDFSKVFRRNLKKSLDDNILLIKDEIITRSNRWISESKTTVELIISE